MDQNKKKANVTSKHTPLNNVNNIIAISSCKGGVGKSTIAANIAQELVRRGHSVGLIDADLYGPSIPTLFNIKNKKVHTNEFKQFIPIEHNGLKLMSFGFLLGDAPAVMRGPIVTRYVQQLLLNADWGELEYLLIDMPPGTGDIQITITQSIRLTGAVIVTTPHRLSLIDVARGILMFEKVAVPIIGVIENMAYIQTEGQDKQYIFGKPTDELQNRFGVEKIAEIPLEESLGQTISSQENNHIKKATDQLITATQNVKERSDKIPNIKYDERKVQFSWENGEHWVVGNYELRCISQDALSVNEITGEQQIKPEDIARDISPKEVIPLGNYAVGITWSDGHSAAIYPYKNIREIASITT